MSNNIKSLSFLLEKQGIKDDSYNETLDSDKKYFDLHLFDHIDRGHLLIRRSNYVSKLTSIPVSTVMMVGLAVFSSMACRKYVVKYRNGRLLPIGLYVAAEQPPGAAKTWCMSEFQAPFFDAHKQACDLWQTEIAEKEKEWQGDMEKSGLLKAMKQRKIKLFTTNATPEGLENVLAHTHGCFSAVSSEQGLFDSLFGGSYGNGKVNNNDVVLEGFAGGYPSFERVTRQAFSGRVVGSVMCFAQPGSIEKIINSAIGTGISERFLMLSEHHALGTRDHLRHIEINEELDAEYYSACAFALQTLLNPKGFDELGQLEISESGYRLIGEYRNTIEHHLVDGGKLSHISLRGAGAKVDMQIMKIASNLHVMSGLSGVIDDKHIKSAIAITDELLEANLAICKHKAIIGDKAEYTSILSLFERDNKCRTERNIIQVKILTAPFKDFTGNRSKAVKVTLEEMVKAGLLRREASLNGRGGVVYVYSMCQ